MNLERHRTLWDLTRGQRLRYALAIAAMGLANVFTFAVPVVIKTVMDGFLAGKSAAAEPTARDAFTAGLPVSPAVALWLAAALIVVLTGLAGVFFYLRRRWAAVASEAIVRRLRDRLFDHLEHLPCSFHDRADTGDLVQRCTSDVETVRVFLSGQVVEIGRATLLVLTVLPVMLWLDVPMTVLSMALFPAIVLFAALFFRRIKALFLVTDEAEGAMTSVLQENLTGIRVVRAFARQEFECEKFADRNARFRDANYRLIRLLGAYWASSDFLCLGQVGLALIGGAWWMLRGELSVGTFFAFLTYESIIIWPVRHMGRVLADAGKAVVSLGRLRQILEEPPETGSEDDPGRWPVPLRGEIDFEGVTFSYNGDDPVLGDLSFRIQPGETVALLGPPGSGKSSIVHLLLRLYDHERGSIRLDGEELAELPRKFVRSQIGVVLQEPFLYSKTIRANVRVGRSQASDEEIVESATAACVHGDLQEFQRGYDTLVGERGVTLSGGQRQRVALARALVKESPVLVLDDALSAVDTDTESRILETLRRRRGRQTTILIAHRLSSVLGADRILVLDRGRIAQAGTHRELIGADGPYRRLWQLQGSTGEETDRRERGREVREG